MKTALQQIDMILNWGRNCPATLRQTLVQCHNQEAKVNLVHCTTPGNTGMYMGADTPQEFWLCIKERTNGPCQGAGGATAIVRSQA